MDGKVQQWKGSWTSERKEIFVENFEEDEINGGADCEVQWSHGGTIGMANSVGVPETNSRNK